jgi:hypothetical protein
MALPLLVIFQRYMAAYARQGGQAVKPSGRDDRSARQFDWGLPSTASESSAKETCEH